jgi:hypothetical protein
LPWLSHYYREGGETNDGEEHRVAHPNQPAFTCLFYSLKDRENSRELY